MTEEPFNLIKGKSNLLVKYKELPQEDITIKGILKNVVLAGLVLRT